MKKYQKIFSLLLAISMMSATMASCGKDDDNGGSETVSGTSVTANDYEWSGDDVSIETESVRDQLDEERDITGQSIVWLGSYYMNPTESSPDRSNALAMFEDEFGGKVEDVVVGSTELFDKLSAMILGGEQVDFFDYQWLAIPNGVYKEQYQPIDGIVDLEHEIWDDVEGFTEMFEVNGEHYMVPLDIADSSIITYSRSLMVEEGLEDPYELFKNGEWTWSKFESMMETFKNNAAEGEVRYGVNGWIGQALMQSAGVAVVENEDGTFVNNIHAPELEQYGLLLQNMAAQNLYDPSWKSYFPEDNLTLFYGMGTWTLKESNNKNPEGDIFIVPMPKYDEADEHYMSVDIHSYMWVKNSTKGDAVGIFLECERLACIDDDFVDAAKEKAMLPDSSNASGTACGWTEEQYDFIMSWKDPDVVTPMFDFGFGISTRMATDGDYTFEGKGVMNNLSSALITFSAVDGYPGTWAELVTMYETVIDEELSVYNN